MTPQEKDELLHLAAIEERERKCWKPLPGPQTRAINSQADILFYGGAGGGGKTDMLLGLAHSHHTKSIIFRRDTKQLQAIEDRAHEIYHDGKYNSTKKIWRFANDRQIEFGGMLLEKDKEKYRGQPHDLYGFDEITGFTQSQFEFVIGWNRTAKSGQRARVVCTGNPPSNHDGYWVKKYWGAWLDKLHHNPAEPGELRWYTTIDGKEIETPNGEPFEHNGELLRPLSRTFIPARIDDNPYLANSNYKSILQNLPEPLRSQMLYGDFDIGMEDDAYQVIPSAWIQSAVDAHIKLGIKPSGVRKASLDIADEGVDLNAVIGRHGVLAEYLESWSGKGKDIYQTVLRTMDICDNHDYQLVTYDADGLGASARGDARVINERRGERRQKKITFTPFKGSSGVDKPDSRMKIGLVTVANKNCDYFLNAKAQSWWALRLRFMITHRAITEKEEFDPDSIISISSKIPQREKLLVELAQPIFCINSAGKIMIDKKPEGMASPNLADALMMVFAPEKFRGF